MNNKFSQNKIYIAAGIIAALAFFLRFYGISFSLNHAIPPGLWFDEALNGLDAYKIHSQGYFRLTYPDIFPREGLFLWLLGISTWVFGDNVFALRIVPCLISTAAVIASFFLAKELSGTKKALLFMLVFSLTRWHIHFGHLILRTNFIPLFSILSLLFMIKTIRKPDSKIFPALAGIFAALGFYTYLAWYFFFPVIPAAFFIITFSDSTERGESYSITKTIRKYKKPIIVLLICFVIIVTPMMIHYLLSPASILARPAAVSPFKGGPAKASAEIIKNIKFVLTMFIHSGDHVSKHNTPLRPVFGLSGVILFWLGLFYSFAKTRKNLKFALIPSWLFLSSLPSVVSITDSANMLRNLGASVPSSFLYTMGIFCLVEIAEKVSGKIKEKNIYLNSAIIIICLLPLFIDLHDYFFKWRYSVEAQTGFLKQITDIAEKSNELSAEYPVFVSSEIADNLAFKYITLNNKNVFSIPSDTQDPVSIIKSQLSSGNAIVIYRLGSDSLKIFIEKFPDAVISGYFEFPGGGKWAVILTIKINGN